MSTPLMDIAQNAADQLTNVTVECEFLALQWAVEHFVGTMYHRNVGMAVECLKLLQEGGHTTKAKFIYNDLDCSAWHGTKWFAHECQNFLMLYLFTSSYEKVDGEYKDVDVITVYKCDDENHLNNLVSAGGSRYRDLRDKEYIGSSNMTSANAVAISAVYSVQTAILNIESLHLALTDGD